MLVVGVVVGVLIALGGVWWYVMDKVLDYMGRGR